MNHVSTLQRSCSILLTQGQMEMAASIAVKRQSANLARGIKDKNGADPKRGWQVHCEGALGEVAFAVWSDRFWDGNLGDLSASDVGPYEVKTRSEHWHDLIIQADQTPDRAYILVTGLAPRFVLRGWIRGVDGKRPEYWKDPAGERPAFFIPQKVLQPMVSLLRRCSCCGFEVF